MPGITATLGTDFARAFAAKDIHRLDELLHPEVDFRGLTPSRSWSADDARATEEILLGQWLEPEDEVDALERIETDRVADRERVGYRVRGHGPAGSWVFEQQAYLAERDGRIGWMRVVCSGFRPAQPPLDAGR